MIPGRSARFLRLAQWYAHRRVSQGLDGVYVHGLAESRALRQAQPVLYAANHVCWWDPLVVVLLDRAIGGEGYALMDAANLQRLPFFGWAGAIALDRQRPAAARRGLKQAISKLSAPGRGVWIFPQGEHRAPWLRPLQLLSGVRLLARQAAVQVVPVSLTYAFREAAQPSVLVCFGEPLDGRQPGLMDELERRIADGLACNDQFLLTGAGHATLVDAPKHDPDGGLGTWILSMLARSLR